MSRLPTPKGFRRLRANEKRRPLDCVWSWGDGPWTLVSSASVGGPYLPRPPHSHWPVIRRKPGQRYALPS